MAGSLEILDSVWPSDDGWPYPDDDEREDSTDLDAEVDDELVSIHALAPHLLDGLTPLEREVLTARFGLDGRPPRSMKELQRTCGVPRADLRSALGDGLAKVRSHLA
jgi:DNA-directed RNA polymerase sigma subunit (sigma70/sigma32)